MDTPCLEGMRLRRLSWWLGEYGSFPPGCRIPRPLLKHGAACVSPQEEKDKSRQKAGARMFRQAIGSEAFLADSGGLLANRTWDQFR